MGIELVTKTLHISLKGSQKYRVNSFSHVSTPTQYMTSQSAHLKPCTLLLHVFRVVYAYDEVSIVNRTLAKYCLTH